MKRYRIVEWATVAALFAFASIAPFASGEQTEFARSPAPPTQIEPLKGQWNGQQHFL